VQTNGFQMLVRSNEDVGRSIYYRGGYEQPETDFFRRTLRPADVCFDVGANVGYFTLLFALCCSEGTVHCFEPVPLNFHTLSMNILLNGYSNVAANTIALSDRPGKAEFCICSDSAFSSFVNTGRKPTAATTLVEMQTLDDYCEVRQIPRVDILKVDVEGAEGRVIAGGRRLLADTKRQPRLVMLELVDAMLGRHQASVGEVSSVMQGHGYTPHVLSEGRLARWRPELEREYENMFFVAGELEVRP